MEPACLLAQTQTHAHINKCTLWLSQIGAEISCATTEVESERRRRQTVAFYTNRENGYCFSETHSMHCKVSIEIQTFIWSEDKSVYK